MITVEDKPDFGRFQLVLDGEVAGFIAYEMHGPRVALMHTQIEDRFAGQGLGVELVARALDEIRRRGGSVLPYCPFVRSFIARNPEYEELVPAGVRPTFGLADRESQAEGQR